MRYIIELHQLNFQEKWKILHNFKEKIMNLNPADLVEILTDEQ